MRDTWFTSDFHFGHFNIIRYCSRSFANTQAMNAAIFDRINACVNSNRDAVRRDLSWTIMENLRRTLAAKRTAPVPT